MRKHPLEGLSITSALTNISRAIWTSHQLGGEGDVYNLPLVIPSHLQARGSPVRSLEWVTLAPFARIGEHLQLTSEIYFIAEGSGLLTTNGVEEAVTTGDLVIAPRGTRHTIVNPSDHPTGFFVAELEGNATGSPTVLHALWNQLQPDTRSFPRRGTLHLASIDLATYLGEHWGIFQVIELLPGTRLLPFQGVHDQVLIACSGEVIFWLEDFPNIQVSSDGVGFSVYLPGAVRACLLNSSSMFRARMIILGVRNREREQEETSA